MDIKQNGLIIGAAIGAILGLGAAYLLINAPSDPEENDKPITSKDLLGLTGSAAAFIRKVDDVRRRT